MILSVFIVRHGREGKGAKEKITQGHINCIRRQILNGYRGFFFVF